MRNRHLASEKMQDVLPVSGAKKLLAKCFAARNGACWARNRPKEPNIGICKVGHVVLTSASPQVFFLRRNINLGFQKRNCALCALNF